ncbi:hypothetical protein [Verrucomicrobium sp. BvORR106]|uniref:hypothetical protein n=1 Tax=Verrucomicrobium sp. BvORR106 TaxID=1403819 RepID=UPI00056EE703|nr:hypothetical protein [Verrucomicrobium sp. BvORR106]
MSDLTEFALLIAVWSGAYFAIVTVHELGHLRYWSTASAHLLEFEPRTGLSKAAVPARTPKMLRIQTVHLA